MIFKKTILIGNVVSNVFGCTDKNIEKKRKNRDLWSEKCSDRPQIFFLTNRKNQFFLVEKKLEQKKSIFLVGQKGDFFGLSVTSETGRGFFNHMRNWKN